MNDDEAARPPLVMAHLARPRRKVRAERTLISSKEANAPIYLKLERGVARNRDHPATSATTV
jgi:hypothetical protein